MSADLLIYRRMRGLFWGGLVVAVTVLPAAVLLAIGIVAAASNLSAQSIHDLGGPIEFFEGGLRTLSLVLLVVGLLMGATAGSVDHQRGVLRDLVLTGRPRMVIALRRIAGAIAWMLTTSVVSIALLTVIALWLAPDSGAMEWSRWARGAISLAPELLSALIIGAGISLIIGTRAASVIVYFVMALFVDNILGVIPTVGDWWQHVSLNVAQGQALSQIAPHVGGTREHVNALPMAWVIYVAWATIPLVAGLLRLQRRDL